MASHISQLCIDLIKSFEGFHARAYWDYRQYSNGYGTRARFAGETISREEAEQRLQNEVASFDAALSRRITNPNLNQQQWAALISAAYNLGTGNLSKHGIIDAVNRGDIATATSQLNKLVHAGGKVLGGLVKRRNQECALLSGNSSAVPANLLQNISNNPARSFAQRDDDDPLFNPQVDESTMSWIEAAIRQGKSIPEIQAAIGPAAPMAFAPQPQTAGMQTGAMNALAPPTPLMNAIFMATQRNLDVRYSQSHGLNISNPSSQGWTDCSHWVRYVMDKYLGLNMPWIVSGMMARTYSQKFNLPFGKLDQGEITPDRLPLFGVVSMLKHDPGKTNNHVVMLTVVNGKRYVSHSSSGRGSDGKTGVDLVPLENYLDDLNRRRLGIEFADLTGHITGNRSQGMALAMNDAGRWRASNAPDINDDFKKTVLRDAITMPTLGMMMTADGAIIMNGIRFDLGFDRQANANVQGSAMQQVAANHFTINIPGNMTASWSMFSAISKMAKQAGMDPGQMQIEIAKEMIRTKGDDSYFRFLQRVPDNYGFSRLKGMPVPSQGQLQQEFMAKQQQQQRQNISTQIEQMEPPAPAPTPAQPAYTNERDAMVGRQGAQNAGFMNSGDANAQGRLSEQFDPRKKLAEAFEIALKENPEVSRRFSLTADDRKYMLLPTDGENVYTGMMPNVRRDPVSFMGITVLDKLHVEDIASIISSAADRMKRQDSETLAGMDPTKVVSMNNFRETTGSGSLN